jgi:hypothetical protein
VTEVIRRVGGAWNPAFISKTKAPAASAAGASD